MNETVRPVWNDATVVREIGGETFVIDPETTTMHSLNAVGAAVQRLADGSRTVGDIVSSLVDDYDVDRKVLENDVREFLATLSELGLIGWQE